MTIINNRRIDMTETEVLEERGTVETVVESKDLIVFNDDFNTFDHVIDSLIKVCKHKPIQAEQCTWLVHYKGKCQVKKGSYDTLEPMCIELLDRGITAEIQ